MQLLCVSTVRSNPSAAGDTRSNRSPTCHTRPPGASGILAIVTAHEASVDSDTVSPPKSNSLALPMSVIRSIRLTKKAPVPGLLQRQRWMPHLNNHSTSILLILTPQKTVFRAVSQIPEHNQCDKP